MNPTIEGKLQQMTDEELLRTVTAPLNKERIKVRAGSNRPLDGNTRIIEMQRRMRGPKSIFKPDTMIPVDEDF